MIKPNQALRLEAAGAGIKLWQIAYKIGYTDSHFSRLLRKELSANISEKAYKALQELKENES